MLFILMMVSFKIVANCSEDSYCKGLEVLKHFPA